MYKKITFLLLATAIALMVSGCAKYSANIEITNNDKAIVSQVIAVDIETLKSKNPSFDANDPFRGMDDPETKKKEAEYQAKGYKISRYANENYIGKEFKRTFMRAHLIKPENLPEGLSAIENESYPITIKRNPYVSSYFINLKYNPDKIENLISSIKKEQNIDIDLSALNTDLTIKIPKKAYENNATIADDKKHKYTWDLTQGSSNQIILKYKKINFFGILFTIIAIIATIIVFNNNKQYMKSKDDDNMSAF